jgi:hypothetical protein
LHDYQFGTDNKVALPAQARVSRVARASMRRQDGASPWFPWADAGAESPNFSMR